ncbi:MAG: HEPN domain-containing protein [Phenylobacterium sp.]|uniref:HEPN domain-containing protein n=1 Tax=Phenylobacterium sp. TaxID=1871053 RepID=UPI0027330C0B|nr:HEPN domain-containing protein [Phenylobacterium sp.]MDP3747191.1 HEPN domain-containing protein [Phenylobacterium sp.]
MMRTDLDHLPESKRRELERVVQILFEEFEAKTRNRSHQHLKLGRILKIVLFGSYARGDWVEDKVSGYASDYDLLVVVSHDDLTDVVEYWGEAEDTLMRAFLISREFTAPVNFIVHSLGDVNRQLGRGRPFFIDILRDGIALYETAGHEFTKPKPLSPQEILTEAKGHYGEWFTSAGEFFDNFQFNAKLARNNNAAFQLHQTTERLYHCLLLVLTLYSPKSHRLNFLRSQAERLDPRLIEAWPRDTKASQRAFELLRRAYVDARYSPHFKITDDELEWLGARIVRLQQIVQLVCEERLTALGGDAGG